MKATNRLRGGIRRHILAAAISLALTAATALPWAAPQVPPVSSATGVPAGWADAVLAGRPWSEEESVKHSRPRLSEHWAALP